MHCLNMWKEGDVVKWMMVMSLITIEYAEKSFILFHAAGVFVMKHALGHYLNRKAAIKGRALLEMLSYVPSLNLFDGIHRFNSIVKRHLCWHKKMLYLNYDELYHSLKIDKWRLVGKAHIRHMHLNTLRLIFIYLWIMKSDFKYRRWGDFHFVLRKSIVEFLNDTFELIWYYLMIYHLWENYFDKKMVNPTFSWSSEFKMMIWSLPIKFDFSLRLAKSFSAWAIVSAVRLSTTT